MFNHFVPRLNPSAAVGSDKLRRWFKTLLSNLLKTMNSRASGGSVSQPEGRARGHRGQCVCMMLALERPLNRAT